MRPLMGSGLPASMATVQSSKPRKRGPLSYPPPGSDSRTSKICSREATTEKFALSLSAEFRMDLDRNVLL
jgi:hypothetical protein